MAISFTRYVDIASSVAGANVVAVRQLMGRIFTSNSLLPPATSVTFSGGAAAALASCASFFGASSAEYARALFYFSWVSKSGMQAQAISFAAVAMSARAPIIWGTKTQKALAAYQSITAGTFTLDLNGTSNTFGPLNFSSASSLAAVATIVQAAINAASGTLWSAATVSFDATTQRFNFTGGVAGACTISVIDGTQQVAAALGWTSAFPATIVAPGADAQQPVDALTASAQASNNFGSFLFQDTLSLIEATALAQWVASQNVNYRYCVPVNAATAAAWSAALAGFSGVDMVLSPLANEYPEMAPMIQEAATDYSQRNAASNYMYSQFGLTPSVANDTDANTYDALAVNYYGVTQNAGNMIAFYQRGIMGGSATDPTDENVFSNESWFKSAAGAAIMNLQLSLSQIPANSAGRSQILTQLQGVIQQAVVNGTISVGKTLAPAQQSAVTQFTGDPKAWYQVQNQGWWVDCTIAPYTNANTNKTEYRATYTLVYSKDDVVRVVDGQHVLI